MKKLSAAFGTLPMTWPVVCAFAAIIGIYVGVINQIPILYDTSFRDIAVTYEWWVLFALLIRVKLQKCQRGRAKMPCVLSHQSAGDFSRRTAFDRIGQSSVLLHQNMAADHPAHAPRWCNRLLCEKAKRVGRSCSQHRQYRCCSAGRELFSKALSFFPAASADGRFLCCDHCRSSYGDAAEVEDKIFVGGYDSTADGRRYYLGCAQ